MANLRAADVTCDALIVGAGPVGLTMALELLRYGVKCRIVDLAAQPTDKSKALVIWGRTLELLGGRPQLVADLSAAGMPGTAASIYGNGKRVVHLEFSRDDTAFPQPLMIPQCDTEHILTNHLAAQGVHVERSVELVDFVDDGPTVRVTLQRAAGSQEHVTSRWLLGCDGSHSTVRKRLGIEFSGDFEPNDWLLADVHVVGPLPPSEISIFWHAQGIAAFFPIGKDRFRVIADLGKAKGPEKPPDPTLDEVQQALATRGLTDYRLNSPIWLAGFRIHERKVADYNRGRVFLAGDAAHIHSPAGGQGMNTGMQDACNLAWKLALVHRGRGRTAPLLDSYSQERSAVGDMVLRNAGRLTTVATLRNPFLQFVRNHVAELAGRLTTIQQRAIADLTEMTIHYPDSALNGDDPGKAWKDQLQPGDRLPDATVVDAATQGPTRLLAHLRGQTHRLLLLPAKNDPGLIAGLLAGAAGATAGLDDLLSIQLVLPAGASGAEPGVTFISAPLVDTNSEVRDRLGVSETAIALVRPDLYLGFRGNHQSWQALRALLERYLVPADR